VSGDAPSYLTAAEADPAGAVEEEWQLLLRYGDAYLQDIATAAADDAVLRRSHPWVSHGTLHLLHRTFRFASSDGRGLAFHPAGDGAYQVYAYDGRPDFVGDAAAVVAFASQVAASWDNDDGATD
jgi:hypothetical protein